MEGLMDEYFNFLKSMTSAVKLGDFYEITVPLFDFDGDAIQLYANKHGNSIHIDDDGYTLSNLEMAGIRIEGNRLKQIKRTCMNFGVTVDENGKLSVKTNHSDFANKLHSLIQCVLRVDDMNLTSSGRVKSYFLEDVINYFDKNNIFYTESPSFTGITGYIYNFDFLFQRSAKKPERLCKLLNNGTKTNMQSTLFSWSDTYPTRKEDSQFIIIINDENKVDDSIYDAAENYGIKVIPWSKIDNNVQLFQ